MLKIIVDTFTQEYGLDSDTTVTSLNKALIRTTKGGYHRGLSEKAWDLDTPRPNLSIPVRKSIRGFIICFLNLFHI